MTAEVAPSSRKPCLSKQLLKEKVQCPSCGSTLALRTLRFKHLCPHLRPAADVEDRKALMLQRAIQAHALRQQQKQPEKSRPQEVPLQETTSAERA